MKCERIIQLKFCPQNEEVKTEDMQDEHDCISLIDPTNANFRESIRNSLTGPQVLDPARFKVLTSATLASKFTDIACYTTPDIHFLAQNYAAYLLC